MGNPITLTFTSVTKDSPGAGQITIVASYGTGTAYGQPLQQKNVGNIPVPTFSRTLQLSDQALFCIRIGATNIIALDVATMNKIWAALDTSLTFAPYITTQPVAASCVHSSTAATFTVAVTSELSSTYQWQYSADGATSWTNCSGTVNGCVYTNGTTATLTCTPTTTGQTGYFHRCNITNTVGTTTSAKAVLTIT